MTRTDNFVGLNPADLDIAVDALKAAGFTTAEGNQGAYDMGKAHGIIMSALKKLGETP